MTVHRGSETKHTSVSQPTVMSHAASEEAMVHDCDPPTQIVKNHTHLFSTVENTSTPTSPSSVARPPSASSTTSTPTNIDHRGGCRAEQETEKPGFVGRTQILDADMMTTPPEKHLQQNSSGQKQPLNPPPSRLLSISLPRSSSPANITQPLSMASIISTNGSVYAAVPISSELYIFPQTSMGFHWNRDLFLKSYQRQSLGIDHLFSGSGNGGRADSRGSLNASQCFGDIQQNNSTESYPIGLGGRTGQSQQEQVRVDKRQQHQRHQHQHQHQRQHSAVLVHEIHVDEHEIAGILPSWP